VRRAPRYQRVRAQTLGLVLELARQHKASQSQNKISQKKTSSSNPPHTPPRTRSPSSRHPPFTHYPFPLRSLVCGGQPRSHKSRLVVSHSTCPPLSSSPHAHSFVLGTTVINTHIPLLHLLHKYIYWRSAWAVA
jgi:hypothetical protein